MGKITLNPGEYFDFDDENKDWSGQQSRWRMGPFEVFDNGFGKFRVTNTTGSPVTLDPNSFFSSSGANQANQNVEAFDTYESGSYGIETSTRLPIEGFSCDPFAYEAEFTLKLVKNAVGEKRRGSIASFQYSVEGIIRSPNFELEKYFFLRKRHLLFEARPTLPAQVELGISPFHWTYNPRTEDGQVPDPKTEAFKERARASFGDFIRNEHALLRNAKEAVKTFFETLDKDTDRAVFSPTDDNDTRGLDEILKSHLHLKKEFATYSKEVSGDILDYLFGERYAFFNGDEPREEEGRLLIPNYWVKLNEHPGLAKDFVGYGVRAAVIEWGIEPFPWAMLRLNAIWNSVEQVIRQKVEKWGKKAPPNVKNRTVLAIALSKGKLVWKRLTEQYFDSKFTSEQMEVVTALAIGELQAEIESRERGGSCQTQ